MKNKLYTAIGLMSGTSMDGVDVSLIRSNGIDQFINILDEYHEYEDDLHQRLISLRNLIINFEDLDTYIQTLSKLEREITLFHGKIVNEIISKYKDEIDFVGFHGQTIFHNPKKKISKQLGDGRLLSQLIKKKVVYDFRQADLENNGQGAPLVPIFHYLLSKNINKKYHTQFPICFINIGGISNITKIIKSSGLIEKNLEAFDIGPGNCLIDYWIRNHSKKRFDENGSIAKSGKVNQLILNQAIENFRIDVYDKSLDVKDFDISFSRGLSFEDGCATITNFTAYLIAKGIEYSNNNNKCEKYLLCGGGRKNSFLIKSIKDYLPDQISKCLDQIDEYSLNGDYIESQAFGYLAIRSFLNLPISYPKTTSCNVPTVGGKVIKNY